MAHRRKARSSLRQSSLLDNFPRGEKRKRSSNHIDITELADSDPYKFVGSQSIEVDINAKSASHSVQSTSNTAAVGDRTQSSTNLSTPSQRVPKSRAKAKRSPAALTERERLELEDEQNLQRAIKASLCDQGRQERKKKRESKSDSDAMKKAASVFEDLERRVDAADTTGSLDFMPLVIDSSSDSPDEQQLSPQQLPLPEEHLPLPEERLPLPEEQELPLPEEQLFEAKQQLPPEDVSEAEAAATTSTASESPSSDVPDTPTLPNPTNNPKVLKSVTLKKMRLDARKTKSRTNESAKNAADVCVSTPEREEVFEDPCADKTPVLVCPSPSTNSRTRLLQAAEESECHHKPVGGEDTPPLKRPDQDVASIDIEGVNDNGGPGEFGTPTSRYQAKRNLSLSYSRKRRNSGHFVAEPSCSAGPRTPPNTHIGELPAAMTSAATTSAATTSAATTSAATTSAATTSAATTSASAATTSAATTSAATTSAATTPVSSTRRAAGSLSLRRSRNAPSSSVFVRQRRGAGSGGGAASVIEVAAGESESYGDALSVEDLKSKRSPVAKEEGLSQLEVLNSTTPLSSRKSLSSQVRRSTETPVSSPRKSQEKKAEVVVASSSRETSSLQVQTPPVSSRKRLLSQEQNLSLQPKRHKYGDNHSPTTPSKGKSSNKKKHDGDKKSKDTRLHPPPVLYAHGGVSPAKYTKAILHSFSSYFSQLAAAQSQSLHRVPWGKPIQTSSKQPGNSLVYCGRKTRNTRKSIRQDDHLACYSLDISSCPVGVHTEKFRVSDSETADELDGEGRRASPQDDDGRERGGTVASHQSFAESVGGRRHTGSDDGGISTAGIEEGTNSYSEVVQGQSQDGGGDTTRERSLFSHEAILIDTQESLVPDHVSHASPIPDQHGNESHASPIPDQHEDDSDATTTEGSPGPLLVGTQDEVRMATDASWYSGCLDDAGAPDNAGGPDDQVGMSDSDDAILISTQDNHDETSKRTSSQKDRPSPFTPQSGGDGSNKDTYSTPVQKNNKSQQWLNSRKPASQQRQVSTKRGTQKEKPQRKVQKTKLPLKMTPRTRGVNKKGGSAAARLIRQQRDIGSSSGSEDLDGDDEGPAAEKVATPTATKRGQASVSARTGSARRARGALDSSPDSSSDVIDLTSATAMHKSPRPTTSSDDDGYVDEQSCPCPVCNKMFSKSEIQLHVDRCLESKQQSEENKEKRLLKCHTCLKMFDSSVIHIHREQCDGADDDSEEELAAIRQLRKARASGNTSASHLRPKKMRKTLTDFKPVSPQGEIIEILDPMLSDQSSVSSSPVDAARGTLHHGHLEAERSPTKSPPTEIHCEDGGVMIDPDLYNSPIKAFKRINDLDPEERASFQNQFHRTSRRRITCDDFDDLLPGTSKTTGYGSRNQKKGWRGGGKKSYYYKRKKK